jgi:hypothetical protein
VPGVAPRKLKDLMRKIAKTEALPQAKVNEIRQAIESEMK